MAQLCSQLENVLSKIRPRVDMLWIITCSGRITSFFSRFDRYVRYKPLRPPEEALRRLKWYIGMFAIFATDGPAER